MGWTRWSLSITSASICFPTLWRSVRLELEKDGHEKVRVEGQLVFNSIFEVCDAAVAGFGLAYVPDDLALPHIAKGNLTRVLEDWCAPWPGCHLYYPVSWQSSAAFDPASR